MLSMYWWIEGRNRALALALLVVPLLPVAPAIAQPPRPNPAIGLACQGAAVLPANHPDIQTLRSLLQRYNVSYAQVPRLDGPLTHYDFAIALRVLAEAMEQESGNQPTQATKKADLLVVQRLQQAYSPDTQQESFRVQNRGLPGRRLGGGGRPPSPATAPFPTGATSPVSPGMTVFSPPSNRTGQAAAKTPASTSRSTSPNIVTTGELRYESDELRDRSARPGNTEGYNPIDENPFFQPNQTPLSTFSIDVDTASYSNVRRFLNGGQLPPKDAVRVEEMINYFTYDYPQPTSDRPFSVNTEVTTTPWNPQHKLVQIGLKGKQLQTLQPSNLVFLVDVSGSMGQPNKLPLVKQSLCLLVNELKAQDRVTLVVYAGNAGVVLSPTPGDLKEQIMRAIDNLEAGGSTAGGEGIQLAYKLAQQNFLKQGNNRVILATDGDFNVGASSDAELVRLIEQKRDQGIFLTVLGFGTGNYKDSKMEQLADKGNGNYAYIDTLSESRKVLVHDLRGTLFTIAKDVKIQVEFNPAKVQAYRLIGYENRILKDQDFNDDKKDAGEIGAGHSVTALYEIIPTGITSDVKLPQIDPLKYQRPQGNTSVVDTNELLHVKLRYKAPNGTTSQLLTQSVLDQPVPLAQGSPNLQFSSAVAMFGLLLRDSEFKGTANPKMVMQLASQAKGSDRDGYRVEFIRLVQRYQDLQESSPKSR